MRVVSGSARGRRLQSPEGLSTRPTADMVKESLFNILAPHIYETSFLDLFAGSGGMGIEALSRGAGKAVFVDNSTICTSIIKNNLETVRLAHNAEVMCMDAASAIKRLGERGEKFDIIFLDPPYESGLVAKTAAAVLDCGILAKDGIIIAEGRTGNKFDVPKGLTVIREKIYKTATMTFMALEDV